MKRNQAWWDNWFLGLAEYIASASKDPSTKVGAVIVDENRRIISTGYNGFARKMPDDERLNDRSEKLALTIHAEINAILFSERSLLENSTMYTWPFQPCSNCSSHIIQVGIKRVVAPFNLIDRWKESFEKAANNFSDANVELVLVTTLPEM